MEVTSLCLSDFALYLVPYANLCCIKFGFLLSQYTAFYKLHLYHSDDVSVT